MLWNCFLRGAKRPPLFGRYGAPTLLLGPPFSPKHHVPLMVACIFPIMSTARPIRLRGRPRASPGHLKLGLHHHRCPLSPPAPPTREEMAISSNCRLWLALACLLAAPAAPFLRLTRGYVLPKSVRWDDTPTERVLYQLQHVAPRHVLHFRGMMMLWRLQAARTPPCLSHLHRAAGA